MLKFTWKPLWWQLRVDAIVFANNGIYRWIVANAISVKLPNLSKIVWTRLKLNAEATNTDSWNLWSFESVLLSVDGLKLNSIWDVPLYINVSKPNLNPFFQFWIWSRPSKKDADVPSIALCLSYKCFSRTFLAFLGHSVVLVQFCQIPK